MASLTQGIFQARVLEWVAIAFSDPYRQVVPKDPRQHGLFASPSFPHISPHCTLLPLRNADTTHTFDPLGLTELLHGSGTVFWYVWCFICSLCMSRQITNLIGE